MNGALLFSGRNWGGIWGGGRVWKKGKREEVNLFFCLEESTTRGKGIRRKITIREEGS